MEEWHDIEKSLIVLDDHQPFRIHNDMFAPTNEDFSSAAQFDREWYKRHCLNGLF